jgi:hypothetical protein
MNFELIKTYVTTQVLQKKGIAPKKNVRKKIFTFAPWKK